MSDRLPQTVTLTIDAYGAMMLDLLVTAAIEIGNHNVESGSACLRSADRLAGAHHASRDALMAALARIADAIPSEVYEQEGMKRATLADIRRGDANG